MFHCLQLYVLRFTSYICIFLILRGILVHFHKLNYAVRFSSSNGTLILTLLTSNLPTSFISLSSQFYFQTNRRPAHNRGIDLLIQ